mgnify:CR=1 FL=1
MKMKKWLAVLCAIAMLCTTACNKTESTKVESVAPTETVETEVPTTSNIKTFEGEVKKENLVVPTEEKKSETTAKVTEAATSKPAPESSTVPESETKGNADTPSVELSEFEEIKTIAEKGYEAAISNDYANMVKYINYDIMWYMAKGNWVTDEEIVAELEKASQGIEVGFDESGTLSSSFEELEDLEFTNVQECSAEELKEINEFMLRFANETDTPINFTFTKAYKLSVTYSNMSESEKAMLGTEAEPRLYVVEYNGKKKLDGYITILMELYAAFAGLEAEMGSVDVGA